MRLLILVGGVILLGLLVLLTAAVLFTAILSKGLFAFLEKLLPREELPPPVQEHRLSRETSRLVARH